MPFIHEFGVQNGGLFRMTTTDRPVSRALPSKSVSALRLDTGSRRFLQCESVAFGVFEVNYEPVFADAHSWHQYFAVVLVTGIQCWINRVHVNVSRRSVMCRRVAVAGHYVAI